MKVFRGVLFLLCASLGLAQTTTGTISGRVLDPASQAVPGAMVTLTKRDTREIRTFTSDNSGEFVFTSIQPGVYDLSIRATGFKTLDKKGLSLSASEHLSAGDLPLKIGAISESVEVTAEIAPVQT